MSTVELRVARETDLPVLERDVRSSFGRSHRHELVDQAKGDLTLLTAWIDLSIVGSGFIRWLGPRAPLVREAYPNVPEIYRLSVDPQHQSQGIGSRLTLRLEQEASKRDMSTVGLGVAFDNPRAYALYERLGYKASTITEYYDEYLLPRTDGTIAKVRDKCRFLIKQVDA